MLAKWDCELRNINKKAINNLVFETNDCENKWFLNTYKRRIYVYHNRCDKHNYIDPLFLSCYLSSGYSHILEFRYIYLNASMNLIRLKFKQNLEVLILPTILLTPFLRGIENYEKKLGHQKNIKFCSIWK